MGWPDWWPANPIGSAYDEAQKNREQLTLLFYLIGGLALLIAIIYLWRKWHEA